MEGQQKQFSPHKNPLRDRVKLVKDKVAATSATVEWEAIAGGEEYIVYYLEDMLADVPATRGPVIKAACAEPGTKLSAKIENLNPKPAYTVYIRVERGGKYFAILNGEKVPANR